MTVTVGIPTPLQSLTRAKQVEVHAVDVREAIAAVDSAHPGFRDRILDSDGNVRRFVNVYVDGQDVRFGDGLDTRLADDDKLLIIPAIAGGGL